MAQEHSLTRITVERGDTLANVLRRRIADDILTGTYAPGAKLDERKLADQFGVSRTPIREALQQLTQAGLATSKPRSGTIVNVVEPARVASLCEAMILLETLCAKLAATRITTVELGRLRRIHEACEECHRNDDADGYAAENRKFHSAIIDATHNVDLAEVVEFCRLRIAPFQRLPFRSAHRREASQSEHRAVIAALEVGDPDATATAMTDHLAAASTSIDDYIREALML
ncbi:MAG: GntR family transcriptional regulator [Rhizobiaceae bacterium]|nr:GntR family transcriptional regulator [Rhizobiaceae bacterium]